MARLEDFRRRAHSKTFAVSSSGESIKNKLKHRLAFLSDYVFTLEDLQRFHKGPKYDIRFQKRDKWDAILFIFAFTMLTIATPWHTESILFLLFIIALFYWRLDARLPLGLGLVCLILIPLILLMQNIFYLVDWTERITVWAFYFLCIGVFKQMIDLIRQPK